MIQLLKNIAKGVLYRPKLKRLGPKSYIMRPRTLINPDRIEIGRDCIIGRCAEIFPLTKYGAQSFDSRIVVGDNVYIGKWVQLHAMGSITIGDGCVLSDYVYISDTAHDMDPTKGLIMTQPLVSKGPVRVGEHTFVGLGSSILPGVILGKRCIVGARAVVTRSFPDYSVIVGNPARLIRTLNPETEESVKMEEVE
jgi:acetyltransferase-like isoleucine patch superfamily enzyme